jgi:GTPase SAR1 family protein
MHFRGVSVAIVVYDVGDRTSFDSIETWLKDARDKQEKKIGSEGTNVIYYIIGNKSE